MNSNFHTINRQHLTYLQLFSMKLNEEKNLILKNFQITRAIILTAVVILVRMRVINTIESKMYEVCDSLIFNDDRPLSR